MKLKLDDIYKKISKTDNKSEIKYLRREIDLIADIAKSFGIIDTITEKIRELNTKYNLDITIKEQKTLTEIRR